MHLKGTSLAAAGEGRNNNLDFLRFFFALLVILDHSFVIFQPDRSGALGRLAVDGFFIISGYLIVASWFNTRSAPQYLKKRILRLYPAYIVVTLLATLVLGCLGSPNPGRFFHSIHPAGFIAKTLLFATPADYRLLPRFANQPFPHTINLSLWTLPYEFACYLMVAVFGIVGLYRKRSTVVGLFVIVLSLILLQARFAPNFWDTFTLAGRSLEKFNQFPRLLAFFLGGMACYLYRDRIVLNRALFCVAFVLMAIGLFSEVLAAVTPLATIYVVLYLGYSNLLKFQGFSKYGDMSYGVYVYGWPVQKVLLLYFGGSLSVLTLWLSASLISCGFAMLSWHCIEKPCLKLKFGTRRLRWRPAESATRRACP